MNQFRPRGTIVPFRFDDFTETVYHTAILFAGPFDLQLKSGFDNVKRVHDENLCDTRNCSGGELVLEREG